VNERKYLSVESIKKDSRKAVWDLNRILPENDSKYNETLEK